MNVIAIGAHIDDIVIGCGGTLSKFVDRGARVFGLTMTNSETHFNERDIHRTSEDAHCEEKMASKIIGYDIYQFDNLDINVGELCYSASLMKKIESILFENHIDYVFTHWRNDINTDHAECFKIVRTAARHTKNVLTFRTNWYCDATAPIIENVYSNIDSTIYRKVDALHCFKTEIDNRGEIWLRSFIDYNETLGFWRGAKFVEAFECVKMEMP
jgi:LmbE family N-acetylglucosaminyl deacetylase